MPKRKCGFGFNCAAMMLQPELEPTACPNYQVCGSTLELMPDEEVELVRVPAQQQETEGQRQHVQERIRVSRSRAAVMMLMARGCPQTLESLGVVDLLASIEDRVEELRSQLASFSSDDYIAPEGCEVHCYNVKRSSGIYWYNKLASKRAIFEPEAGQAKVKVIHLSHDDDPRNQEGRRGIERRNQLTQVETQLQLAEAALQRAAALLHQKADGAA